MRWQKIKFIFKQKFLDHGIYINKFIKNFLYLNKMNSSNINN